jgi:hypothetical protein
VDQPLHGAAGANVAVMILFRKEGRQVPVTRAKIAGCSRAALMARTCAAEQLGPAVAIEAVEDVGAGGSLSGFRLGTKTPCAAHRIDQPSPNFGRSAERPSLRAHPCDPETSAFPGFGC